MEKAITITKLLGITQEDAARLLGVSTSQWSMYSSGKRDLPAPAMALLAEMLSYVQSAETNPKNKKTQDEPQKNQKYFEMRLQDNAYRQQQLALKMAAAQRKKLVQSRILLLSEFLEKRSIDKKVDMGFEVLKMKATKAATSAVGDLLAEQQYQKELLELEQTMLESKLEALRKGKGT